MLGIYGQTASSIKKRTSLQAYPQIANSFLDMAVTSIESYVHGTVATQDQAPVVTASNRILAGVYAAVNTAPLCDTV